MEVLGLRGGMAFERDDINRRFRRLLRDAHPDSGGVAAQAASGSRSSARRATILLDVASDASRPRASFGTSFGPTTLRSESA